METVRDVFRRHEVLCDLDAVVKVPDLVGRARWDEYCVTHVLDNRVTWNKKKRGAYCR